jgi:RimK-like ATP-grasp domain
MTLKVGLIVGREWSFPPAFIEEVNGRGEGVVAEYVKLGAPMMDEPCEYAVIIDRISHEVPFYRTYLKQAALQGCTVVNNPFMWTADDKFFGAALATSLGIAHPKTVVLPNKEYIPGIVHDESLRNLKYPLDWEAIVEYVGMPCILKDAHGGGWKEVYVCRSLEELIHHYDQSGLLTMIVQEFIEWDQFIRCIVIGQEVVMPIKYDPGERKYHVEHDHLGPELGKRVVDDSLKLVRALGYDMNSMEWAVKDGVPYAIDFMNPAPDMDLYSLTPHYFDWVVKTMADMAIRLAKNPRPQAKELRWDGFFAGGRIQGGPGLLSGGRGGEGGNGGEGGKSGSEGEVDWGVLTGQGTIGSGSRDEPDPPPTQFPGTAGPGNQPPQGGPPSDGNRSGEDTSAGQAARSTEETA